ncbi:MAG: protein-L-isoaspartate O-methyltransferase family protein, partial [Bacteroidota bacterium]
MIRKVDLVDTLIHKGQRKRLVEELRTKGISSEVVLNAIDSVPRQWFFPKDFDQYVYRDAAFPIDHGQTISQPFTVAYQTQLSGVSKGEKVLEIGTGSGYQAAILLAMGADVYSVEFILPIL